MFPHGHISLLFFCCIWGSENTQFSYEEERLLASLADGPSHALDLTPGKTRHPLRPRRCTPDVPACTGECDPTRLAACSPPPHADAFLAIMHRIISRCCDKRETKEGKKKRGEGRSGEEGKQGGERLGGNSEGCWMCMCVCLARRLGGV